VGKSTLINRLAGHQVSIVHDRPGTTRDPTQLRLTWQDNHLLFVDTAGLRRRSKVNDPVEFYSTRRATNSIDQADVAVVLIDSAEGWVMQDARIMEQVIKSGCGLVVAINKWDLVAEKTAAEYRRELRDRYPFLRDYPVLCISGLTGRRVHKCLEVVAAVGNKRRTRIPTARLNKIIQQLSGEYLATQDGRDIRLLYATQHAINPPAFTIFTNLPRSVPGNYRRHIENRLRSEFDFEGTPLRIVWRRRKGYREMRS
jgi:GTP-binding protein